jgi:hypothetical protein
MNAETQSSARATALSFKGLSFNLAYGGIGLIYSLLVYKLRRTESMQAVPTEHVEAELFKSALSYFPSYFIVAFVLVLLFGLLNRRSIDTSPLKKDDST